MATKVGVALLALAGALVNADAVYTKNSPVLQVTAKTYDSLIAQSNYSSIVEFYAPWCGHCQNLKPAYEKAAKNLDGLAKVAAINCDDDSNKPFCGQMGVQGFPTLKIVKPGNKRGRPMVEDYQGPRTAKAIVDAVIDKIPNHVKKLQDSTIDNWLADTATSTKAILFTEKGTTSALIRALAIEFLGSVSVGQIRSKEQTSVDKFGVSDFPSIVVIPGDGSPHTVYSADMKRQPLIDLLSKFASPNPDPAPGKAKATKAKDQKKAASASSSFSKASEAHKSSDLDDELGAKTIVLDEDTPTESPLPIVDDQKPAVMPEIPAIPILASVEELNEAALGPKKGTCILVLLPAGSEVNVAEEASEALIHFANIADKHTRRRDNTFPFYGVSADNEQAKVIRADLGLQDDSKLEIIAVNNKRGWWRHFKGDPSSFPNIENFIDAIKLGDGQPEKLPTAFGGKENEAPAPEPEAEPEIAEDSPTDETVADPEPELEPEPEPEHDEL
ncbi:protein disulfide-isomerase domain [Cyphellophora europaea CBS 101466]|uniref:protein disulfide-isomerase n=1 Tax=Cyphellophora europaea (strain CBS 101466) TaxID=1220924 RepID=W2RMG2_CYPE1|nr:protein disulfide-isomerase domain [Cyphellophora europaea CBS 101466]ETN36899.1 protein disulfide-isomerase domain [Cyphellophora europaea CBS 101466]